MAVRVTLNQGALASVLRGPDSPVRRDLRAKAERIRRGAVAACPVRSGQLRDALVLRDRDRNVNPGVVVGTFAPAGVIGYAYYTHEGTRPHPIFPRNARVLAFRGRDGSLVFSSHVNHPGTEPRPYLLIGARNAGFPV